MKDFPCEKTHTHLLNEPSRRNPLLILLKLAKENLLAPRVINVLFSCLFYVYTIVLTL